MVRQFFVFFLLVHLPSASRLAAQDTTGVGMIAGVVNTVAGRAAASVKVCVAGSERCTATDERGGFRLVDLRPGTYRLELAAPNQPAVKSEAVEVRAGLEARVELALPNLEAVQQSVTVSESVYVAPEEVKNSGYLVTSQEVFKSAGALQDVSRYIQTLPGVAIGADDFRNDIIVRGGSPLENLFVVDNIEIPNINTFANFASAGGSVSILDAAMIQDTTFLTGGYPAPYVNRASSVLQVTQREGSRDEFHGRATVGFAGAGGILDGPINGGKGSWIVSARRSFLDLFTDDTGIGGVPVLYTFNGKMVYDLTPRDRIWGVSVTGVDKIRLGRVANPSEDLAEDELNNLDIRYQGWRSANGFNWQRLFGSKGVGLFGFTNSQASTTQQVKDLVRGALPPLGSVEEQIEAAPVVFRDDSREGETTLKYDFTAFASGMGKIQAGGNFKIFNLRYNTAAPFGSDNPYSPTPDSNPFFLDQRFRAYQSGAYLQTSKNLTSRLNLTIGGRFDNYSFLSTSRFSPRAGLSYRITERLSWRASYGQYYQQPFFLFLTAFPINAGATAFRADHYVTGFSYRASPTLRMTLEAYRKDYKDYPTSLQYPQLSLANIGDTFNVRDILFPLTSAGRGQAQGIEFFMEKKFSDKWYGQTNMAFSRSRQAGLDGVRRPSSYDYPRIFNLVGGYRFNPKWELSARFAYLSGRPYTPFDEAVSTAQRRGVFDLNRVNAQRLPDYVRLDLRVDRTFSVRDKPLLVFAGVQNAFNRTNVAGYTWNRGLNRPETNEQLGIFPIFGIDWRF